MKAIYRSIWSDGVVETPCLITDKGEVVDIEQVEPQISCDNLVNEEVEILETGEVHEIETTASGNVFLKLKPTPKPTFCRDSELSIAFYNKGNYESYSKAEEEGAGYPVSSSISLYGSSGIYDLQEVVGGLLECIGTDEKYTLVIQSESGDYLDADDALKIMGDA